MIKLLPKILWGPNCLTKRTLLSSLCFLIVQVALAQQEVSGTITDQKGIPISGLPLWKKTPPTVWYQILTEIMR
ncbi:hypothetical protein Q2T41_08735 [Maribacter confluentis]|uniref:Carboxypeptidase regulatory-like domain-containing protein n=1 Tax=Maribacter confluentis TaxID=1656093 RepID=A0ABT8RPC3_9FLAO|nr:hypothetical protein [Maribacter confluentis]MDO1512740.1 hypothetical protein [Maribacter confluentis]